MNYRRVCRRGINEDFLSLLRARRTRLFADLSTIINSPPWGKPSREGALNPPACAWPRCLRFRCGVVRQRVKVYQGAKEIFSGLGAGRAWQQSDLNGLRGLQFLCLVAGMGGVFKTP